MAPLGSSLDGLTVYVAGQPFVDEDGHPTAAGDMVGQLAQAFDNLATVLRSAGLAPLAPVRSASGRDAARHRRVDFAAVLERAGFVDGELVGISLRECSRVERTIDRGQGVRCSVSIGHDHSSADEYLLVAHELEVCNRNLDLNLLSNVFTALGSRR
jgi:hypothetical protein